MSKWKLGHVYDCTEYVKQLALSGEIVGLKKPDGTTLYEHGYFVGADVFDLHIYRVCVGINQEYEDEPRTKIVEQVDISKDDLIEKLKELELAFPFGFQDSRVIFDELLEYDIVTINDMIKAAIDIDYERCFENDDIEEYRYDTSLEEIRSDIDGGYGITIAEIKDDEEERED